MADKGLPLSPSSVGTTNRSYNLDAAKEKVNGTKSCGEGKGKERRMESPSKTVKGEKARKRFRCGTLCLWLPKMPGLGKGRERNRQEEAEGGGCISISISISRRVSLETFECGSWASSGAGSLYFDLPMELIRNSVGGRSQSQSQSQPQSPVKAAFVFDRDGKGVHVPVRTRPKLILGEESGSLSPCTITPRLRKARQDFNALLEAHTHTL